MNYKLAYEVLLTVILECLMLLGDDSDRDVR